MYKDKEFYNGKDVSPDVLSDFYRVVLGEEVYTASDSSQTSVSPGLDAWIEGQRN